MGHYFEYDAAVARGAVAIGRKPLVLAHNDVEPHLAAASGAVLSDLPRRSFNVSGENTLYLFQHALFHTNLGWQTRPIFRFVRGRKTYQAICNCHHEVEYEPERDLTTATVPGRYQNFSLNFFWRGVWSKIRCTLHNEYLSMGVFFDLSGSDPMPTTPISQMGFASLSPRISEALGTINEVCTKRYTTIQQIMADPTIEWGDRNQIDREALRSAHEFLHEEIWTLFDRVFEDSMRERKNETLWSQIGSVFYDARIVLLHCPMNPAVFSSPLYHARAKQPLNRHIAYRDLFEDGVAVNYTDAAIPFISANNVADDARIEYTVSRFLGQRVVYISSLAAEHVDSTRTNTPVKSLLLCRPFHSWQLGRLVDRLCLIGSVRVAALINLEQLDRAGDDLRVLTRKVQTAMASAGGLAADEKLGATLTELRQDTARIGETCDGGFEYRVERSRYYVEQYRELERNFRIDFVEGFQRYDYFVRRRLFSAYAFINRLGLRMERHKRELDWLGQQVQTSYNIAVQRDILRLQAIGELLLIIPLTYYTGHVIRDIVASPDAKWVADNAFLISLAFWVVVLGCLAIFDARRRQRIARGAGRTEKHNDEALREGVSLASSQGGQQDLEGHPMQ